MLRVNADLLQRALSYVILISIIALNYYVYTSESYIGDFTKWDSIRVFPPFRFETRVATYDIESGRVYLSISHGLVFSTSIIDREVDLIRVKSRGLDLFIIFTSVFVLIAFHGLSKKNVDVKGFLVAVSLLLALIAINFLYVHVSFKPLARALVYERDQPLFCEEKLNYTMCILDSFYVRSKILVHVDKPVLLVVVNKGTSEQFIVNKTIVRDIVVRGGNVSVYFLSDHKPNVIYRRISIVEDELRGYGLIETLTATSIALKTVIVFLIRRLKQVAS